MSETALETEDGRLKFMQQVISITYETKDPPNLVEFQQRLEDDAIWGHRCPSCDRVYVPPKGFCPICVVETTWDEHAVQVADTGTVTSFTVLTPIQYHGQQEREDYALASVLLDGASGTIGQQRLVDIDLDDIRTGMRVAAVWSHDPDREETMIRGFGFGSAVAGFRPIDEPDTPAEEYRDHVL